MAGLLKKAEEFCRESGLQLTRPRREVLKVLERAAQPLTAYAVLEKLARALDNPKPPTIYRALEFFQKHGFVHRIESLNAYMACGAGHLHHGYQIMICTSCGRVEEMHLCTMPEAVRAMAQKKNFTPSAWNMELLGLCRECQGDG